MGLRFTTKFYEGKIKEMHSGRELSFRNDALRWAYFYFFLIINLRKIQYCLFTAYFYVWLGWFLLVS